MRGVLKFENPGPALPGRSIRVVVQDTSRAGGDAVDVAETRVTVPEDFDAAIDDLSFEIDLDAPRKGLTVRAHLAAHEGSDIRVGDLITTASIPVPETDTEDVALPLRQV